MMNEPSVKDQVVSDHAEQERVWGTGVSKAGPNSVRAEVWAAFEARMASGERDTPAGFSALRLYIFLTTVCGAITFLVPIMLFKISGYLLGPSDALERLGTFIFFACVFWFWGRIVIPVSYDVVWRMDILSDKIAYVRPKDVRRLFALWLGLGRKELPLFRKWSRDA